MTSLRINDEMHATLKGLAESDGVSMQKVLDRAIDIYRRQRFLEEANVAYGSLREYPGTWGKELKEREMWETTLADGSEAE